jgi:hypothetical protein
MSFILSNLRNRSRTSRAKFKTTSTTVRGKHGLDSGFF